MNTLGIQSIGGTKLLSSECIDLYHDTCK